MYEESLTTNMDDAMFSCAASLCITRAAWTGQRKGRETPVEIVFTAAFEYDKYVATDSDDLWGAAVGYTLLSFSIQNRD
jgi:hypothetical protein